MTSGLMTTIQMFSERPLSMNTFVGNRRLFEQWSIIVELRVVGVSPSLLFRVYG